MRSLIFPLERNNTKMFWLAAALITTAVIAIVTVWYLFYLVIKDSPKDHP